VPLLLIYREPKTIPCQPSKQSEVISTGHHICIKEAESQQINLSVYALSVKSSGNWIPRPKASTCRPNKWRSQPTQK